VVLSPIQFVFDSPQRNAKAKGCSRLIRAETGGKWGFSGPNSF
jgi:ribosomal protein S27E